MSGSVFHRYRQIRKADLTMGQTFYLVTLNMFVGNNANAWPSQATIAKAMNAGMRSVRKWQRELTEMGVIRVESGSGRWRPNRYSLDLSKLPLNAAPHAALNDSNTAPHAYGIRHHMPVNAASHADRTIKKDHLKDQSEFPDELGTSDSFKTAWNEWTQYRAEKRKNLTTSTIQKQLAKLAKWGPERAVAAIHNSIEQGWAGLYEPKLVNDGTTCDFGDVRSVILREYSPDVRNTTGVQAALTPAQFAAAKTVGLDRIVRSRADDKRIATEYRRAIG